MPYVKRKLEKPRRRIDSHGHEREILTHNLVKIPFRECTPKQLASSFFGLFGKIAVPVAAGVAVFGPPDIMGDLPRNITPADQLKRADDRADAMVKSLSAPEQFVLAYVKPIEIPIMSYDEESGNGLLEVARQVVDFDAILVNIGQNCLSGTEYDTATSTIIVDQGTLAVMPSQAGLPDLRFAVTKDGLVENPETMEILRSKGCEPGLHTYQKTDEGYVELT